MPSILRLGLQQIAFPSDGDLTPATAAERALAARLEEVEAAARVGVQLLCFPELCTTPFFPAGPDPRWAALGVTAEGDLARVGRAAGMHRCALVFPFPERAPGGRLFSSAAVFDADGRLLGVARRQHLTPGEAPTLAPANGAFPVFPTAVGKVGVALGHDRHLPEVARILGLRGAEIILLPAAATTDLPRALWEAEPLAVAAQNLCWVGACNRVGAERLAGPGGEVLAREYAGASFLADPRGRFHARASRDQAALIRADLPLGRLRQERAEHPLAGLRRPGIYHPLVES